MPTAKIIFGNKQRIINVPQSIINTSIETCEIAIMSDKQKRQKDEELFDILMDKLQIFYQEKARNLFGINDCYIEFKKHGNDVDELVNVVDFSHHLKESGV